MDNQLGNLSTFANFSAGIEVLVTLLLLFQININVTQDFRLILVSLVGERSKIFKAFYLLF